MLEQIETYMVFVWLGIIILSVIIEAFTTELVSIWMALTGLITLVLSVIPGIPFYVEIIVFVVFTLLLLLFTRPLAKKYLLKRTSKTNIDSIIGTKCEVKKEITPLKHGEVVINGVTWSAENVDNNKVIPEGNIVVVIGIKGNKLIVKE